jgi:hypothetical protein
MNVFEKITESPEALASLLRAIPAIETPWDDAFHRLYCSSCSAADCDDCRRPERDSPLWWLGLPAAEVENCCMVERSKTQREKVRRPDMERCELYKPGDFNTRYRTEVNE